MSYTTQTPLWGGEGTVRIITVMRTPVILLLAVCGCAGNIGDSFPGRAGAGGGDDDDGEVQQNEDGSFVCAPDGEPSATPLRRLSTSQYRNTVHDLFVPYGVDASTEAAAELDRVPVDVGDFQLMDRRLSDQHVRAFYRVADRLASAVTTDDDKLRALAGDCAVASLPDAGCLDAFLDGFAARAFRRPLTAEERARYAALDDGTRDGHELFRALVFSLLQAPAFVYHVEVEGDGSDTFFTLGPYELASRLSYHFWQSMPDVALLAAAADGSLLTEEGYADQVDRLFDDPRTEKTIQQFTAEWWHLGWMTQFPTSAAFSTFAQGTTIGQPDADHLPAMTAEIEAMVRHFTFATDGTLRDLFTTDLSFTRSPHLAALYGVEPWDGTSALPRMPAGERAGLLTRAAFLLNDSERTNPVHRGATVRRRLLCENFVQPDPATLPDGALTPPPVTADQTTRQRYEQKTANQPCAGCHSQMNPIGFALERYDAIGRFRTEETVIDEVTGEVLATLPIDTAVTVDIGGQTSSFDSGEELSAAVADSGLAEGCFARQYFRFTYGREEGGADGCSLEEVRSVLAEGGSLREALRAIAFEDGFKSRRVE